MKKFAVFGNPIAQSQSPKIHTLFAQSVGIDIQYRRIEGRIGQVEEDFIQFFNDPQALGANVTMPFKDNAAQWVDELTQGAQAAGAVNTIIRTQDRFVGDSTDGVGLVTDLARLGFALENKTVLLIGAGGAARGAFANILAAQPQSIDIINRSKDKAIALSNVVPNTITRCVTDTDDLPSYDVIINATSLSLSDKVPAISTNVINATTCVYDMVYKNRDTSFMSWAKQNGCLHAADGLGMLVGQAAASFYLWTGLKPDVEPVLKSLRESMGR